jgi:hypothetical protein
VHLLSFCEKEWHLSEISQISYVPFISAGFAFFREFYVSRLIAGLQAAEEFVCSHEGDLMVIVLYSEPSRIHIEIFDGSEQQILYPAIFVTAAACNFYVVLDVQSPRMQY